MRGYLSYLSFDGPLLFRILAVRNIDLLIVEPPPTTGVVACVAATARRVPFVYFAADVWSEAVAEVGVRPVVRTGLRRLERLVLGQAAAVLTVHPAVERVIRQLAPHASITNVGHGADTTTFSPEGERQGTTRPFVVYAGTASEVHGALIFIEAMRQVVRQRPNAHLVVIGQGEERHLMERLAESSLPKGAVTFLPRLTPAETAAWIRGARAALASVRPGPYGFAIATKLFAAAACGTPTVYVGAGVALVRDHRLGEVRDFDVDQLAVSMIRALDGKTAARPRKELVRWARGHASIDAVGRRGVRTLALVLRGGHRRQCRSSSTSPTGRDELLR